MAGGESCAGNKFLSGDALSDVWNIQISGFSNLPGFQGLYCQRATVQGHKFDFVSFAAAVHVHDDAHIAGLQVCRCVCVGAWRP